MAVQLEGCNAQLEKLPPPITAEPTAFVLALVTNFCAELAQRVRGSPSNTALVQSTRRTYEAFKLNIRSSAPPFVPYKDQSQAPRDISEYLRVDANDRSARGKKFAGKIYYLEDVRAHISRCIAFHSGSRARCQRVVCTDISPWSVTGYLYWKYPTRGICDSSEIDG